MTVNIAAWCRGFLPLFCLLIGFAGSGCSGAKAEVPGDDETVAWFERPTVVNKGPDGNAYVLVVGIGRNAGLDESMAMNIAEQDARERLSLYLGGLATAFRKRLNEQNEIAIANSKSAEGKSMAEQTNKFMLAGQTLAQNAVRGMEVTRSKTINNAKYVQGRLNLNAYKQVLAESQALSDAERAAIQTNSAEVDEAFQRAMDDARGAAGR